MKRLLIVDDALIMRMKIREIASKAGWTVVAEAANGAEGVRLFDEHRFTRVLHLAAESHVDRSIVDPGAFLQTNVLGTFVALKAALDSWRATGKMDSARFLHVSTDEVYGSLGASDPAFTESSAYRPNSPYAASKAASDHLVRSFVATYGMPAIITNCSNNYGPWYSPGRVIPVFVTNALEDKSLPVYGNGQAIRDYLFVEDHCSAIDLALHKGEAGETYCVGGAAQRNHALGHSGEERVSAQAQPRTNPVDHGRKQYGRPGVQQGRKETFCDSKGPPR